MSTLCGAIAYEDIDIDISGNTNFSSSETQSMVTNVYVEYTINLYEPDHKQWGLFVAGKVNPAYDHLGNEIKMDVFTVLGIDF
jgi:hypothetical protein